MICPVDRLPPGFRRSSGIPIVRQKLLEAATVELARRAGEALAARARVG